MRTTIHRKSLTGFLALFGETYQKKGKEMGPSMSTLYMADSPDPPLLRGDTAVAMVPGDFNEEVHKQIQEMLERKNVTGIVMFENMDMSSSHLGERTAMIAGPECTYRSVAGCQGYHLGSVPSVFQYPLAAYVLEDKDWDEVAINGTDWIVDWKEPHGPEGEMSGQESVRALTALDATNLVREKHGLENSQTVTFNPIEDDTQGGRHGGSRAEETGS